MKYIAILRGINVGAHRKILMADLKKVLTNLGLKEVITYIQSGNVLFQSLMTKDEIEVLITNTINENYGFEVPVIVIPVTVFAQLPKLNPYIDNTSVEKMHVTFLKKLPVIENAKHLCSIGVDYAPDRFEIQNQIVFLSIADKYHKSKLSNNFFEKKLKVTATTRNWKTVMRLIELSNK